MKTSLVRKGGKEFVVRRVDDMMVMFVDGKASDSRIIAEGYGPKNQTVTLYRGKSSTPLSGGFVTDPESFVSQYSQNLENCDA